MNEFYFLVYISIRIQKENERRFFSWRNVQEQLNDARAEKN